MEARTQVKHNGEFEFQHLSEMRLFIKDQVLGDSWLISSVRFNGDDAIKTGFSSAPGTESLLEVVISNASGTFSGLITDAQHKPVPAGRLVLLPEPSYRSNPF